METSLVERQQVGVESTSAIAPMTAVMIREQVNLIQTVMGEVMQDGIHYGTIPGCGPKPALLKPGAEKLSMVFRLRPIIDNNRDVNFLDMGNGHREVRVYCHVISANGVELSTGVGSCSTMETKYRYRGGEKKLTGKPVPKDYWNLKKEGKIKEALELIGGAGFGVAKGESGWEICELGAKMENPDIADTYNTVLKMAKKRAYVDGILSATAASDIFTQDIDDEEDAAAAAAAILTDKNPSAPQKEAPSMPTRKSEALKPNENGGFKIDRSKMRPMSAKFAGTCAECGQGIAPGDMILYDSITKKAVHNECPYTPE